LDNARERTTGAETLQSRINLRGERNEHNKKKKEKKRKSSMQTILFATITQRKFSEEANHSSHIQDQGEDVIAERKRRKGGKKERRRKRRKERVCGG